MSTNAGARVPKAVLYLVTQKPAVLTLLAILVVACAAFLLVPALANTDETQVNAGGSMDGTWQGYAVSTDGKRVLVSHLEDEASEFLGSVQVFTWNEQAGEWSLEQVLTWSDSGAGDRFGSALGVAGDVIAVGSPGYDSFAGSVCVFEFDSEKEEWRESAALSPTDASAAQCFGSSVAVDGDRIVVGAPSDSENGDLAGAAYVFERDDDDTWVQSVKLSPQQSGSGSCFGASVALHGDIVLVGAPEDSGLAKDSGAAHVFRHSDSGWTLEASLLPSHGAPGDCAGWSVSISGSVAVLGAPFSDLKGTNAGAAYVFEVADEADWIETARLTPSRTGNATQFGRSVSVNGSSVLVGSPTVRHGSPTSGSVQLFSRADGGWKGRRPFTAESQGEVPAGFTVSLAKKVAVTSTSHRSDDSGHYSILHVARP